MATLLEEVVMMKRVSTGEEGHTATGSNVSTMGAKTTTVGIEKKPYP